MTTHLRYFYVAARHMFSAARIQYAIAAADERAAELFVIRLLNGEDYFTLRAQEIV